MMSIGFSKAYRAVIAPSGVVAFESLYHRIPLISSTSLSRCGRALNAGREFLFWSCSAPKYLAITIAAARFERLARPGNAKHLRSSLLTSSAENLMQILPASFLYFSHHSAAIVSSELKIETAGGFFSGFCTFRVFA